MQARSLMLTGPGDCGYRYASPLTVRSPSTAAYPNRTDPSTAAYTPKMPVHRHLEPHVPPVSASQAATPSPRLDDPTSYPSTHKSGPRRRSRGLQAVPAV